MTDLEWLPRNPYQPTLKQIIEQVEMTRIIIDTMYPNLDMTCQITFVLYIVER